MIRRQIAISSGKGGVGKSTVASQLASALALEGFRVGLCDLDIQGPSQATMMGLVELPEIESRSEGEFLIPPVKHGVKVMSMGSLIEPDAATVWRGPLLHQTIQQFCGRVVWGDLDYLFYDLPPGTGDVQLSLAQTVSLTGTLLVTTPQDVSAQDVRKAFSMWATVKVPVLGVIENMSLFTCDGCGKNHDLFGAGAGSRLADRFRTELLAQIPFEPKLLKSLDEGVPWVVREWNSPVSQVLVECARKLEKKLQILESPRCDS